MTKTESVMTSQPTVCDNTLQHSVAEDDSASAEIQSTSIPTSTNDKAQPEGGSKGFADLDYLDGPTIIAEVCPFFHTRMSILTGLQQPFEPHEIENTSVTPRVSGYSPPPPYWCILMTYAAHSRDHRLDRQHSVSNAFTDIYVCRGEDHFPTRYPHQFPGVIKG